jgi:hypothetical protein
MFYMLIVKESSKKQYGGFLFFVAIALIISNVFFYDTVLAQITPNLYTTGASGSQASGSRSNTSSAGVPGIEEQLSVDIVPEIPQPGKDVTITVQTFGVDTNTNFYTWTIDGKEVLKGFGEFRLTFKVGRAGQLSNVKVKIDPSVGMTIERSFSFNPVDVDFLWQANTYTPPFYKGKALYTPEATITLVSLPNMVIQNRRINPADIIYNWKVNYDLKFPSSGFGRNSFTYKGPIINRDDTIQTEVYAASNRNVRGRNSLVLNRVSPQVLFYEDHPTLGILFNKNIEGDVVLSSKEFKLTAYPFHFSTPDRSMNTTFNWFLNDTPINIQNKQSSTVFRRTDEDAGVSSVAVVVGNPTHILQKASALVNVIYEKTTNTSSFGSENTEGFGSGDTEIQQTSTNSEQDPGATGGTGASSDSFGS